MVTINHATKGCVMPKDDTAMIDRLGQLETGTSYDRLRVIESYVRRFCPFEAIGMVSQEIRHSRFLSYLLDPRRPHDLGNTISSAFFDAIGIEDNPIKSLTSADTIRVYRERYRIDILVEIRRAGQRNILLAIENKIWAGEGNEQLERYERRLQQHYPSSDWKHFYCFLTPHGRDAETMGETYWAPVSYTDLLNAINKAVLAAECSGEGLRFLNYYQAMMERHGVAVTDRSPHNNALQEAVESLWAEHREALEYLIENRPEPLGKLIKDLDQQRSKVAEILSQNIGEVLAGDSHFENRKYYWVRFSFPDWIKEYPPLGAGNVNWIKSRSQIALELYADDNNEAIEASFAIGYGSEGDQEFRRKLIREMDKMTETRHNATPSVKHYYQRSILNESDVGDTDYPFKLLVNKLESYLLEHLAKVKSAVVAASRN